MSSGVITIIGSGNSAHVCAGLIHSNTEGKWETRILTRNPQVFETKEPKCILQDGKVLTGKLSQVSDKPEDVIPGSNLVLWTGPVWATKSVFEKVAPFLDTNAVVSTIFGQGLVHVLATRVFGKKVKFVALRNIPWLCRTEVRGQSGRIYGAKKAIEAASLNVGQEWITDNMEFLLKTEHGPVINLSPDFCGIVFNPANQIIHPAIYWGHFRTWNGKKPLKKLRSPYFYRATDEVAGGVLQCLDEELQAIKNAYYEKTKMEGCLSVIPLKTRIVKQYGELVKDSSTMAKTIASNKGYSSFTVPHLKVDGGVAPDPKSRVVQDDIAWGLCVLISIAERLEVPTTTMKWLVKWNQNLLQKEYLTEGKLEGRDVDELVILSPEDPLELVGGLVPSSPKSESKRP